MLLTCRKRFAMAHPVNIFALVVVCLAAFTSGVRGQEDDEPTTAPSTRPVQKVVSPPKENFHVYVLMGQSNMDGRDKAALGAQVDNPRVLALNEDGKWVVARDPMRGVAKGGIGPGIPFALEMIKADPNVTIGLVPCAVGGTPLSRWVKGADLYEKALARAKMAATAGAIKGVLWHQGESDTTTQKNADSYEDRLKQMIQDLRKDLGDPNLPIVVGQLGEFLSTTKYPFVDTVRDALKHIPETVPNVGYADSAGLSDRGDKLHFNAEGAKTLGTRFAKAMQALQKRPRSADTPSGKEGASTQPSTPATQR
jgi:hypothetical protein